MKEYEVQIQFLENNNSMWVSLVDAENNLIHGFDTEIDAEKIIDKVRIENYPKSCRIVKR